MAIITIKDKDGNLIDIPAIKGEKGDKGDPGEKGDKGDPGDAASVDVQLNGTSIVQDGVANIPVASDSTLGLIKTSSSYGFQMTPSGFLNTANVVNSDIDDRKATRMLKPCHIDYAVKAALTDGKGPDWTREEQKNAQKRIGIDCWDEIVMVDTETSKEYKLYIANGKLVLEELVLEEVL